MKVRSRKMHSDSIQHVLLSSANFYELGGETFLPIYTRPVIHTP